MQFYSIPTFLLLAIAFAPATLHAQLSSGPNVGIKVEPLKVFAATGQMAGNEVDFSAERQLRPTLFVFVQADKWDRPMSRFVRTLDQELAKNRQDVQLIAVWLTDDVAKAKEYLPLAQNSLKLAQTTFTVFPGDKNGPQGWGINFQAHVTAVVAQDGHVTASFAHRSVNETDAPAVLEKLQPIK